MSGTETTTTDADLTARQTQLDEREAAFAARTKATFTAGNNAALDALVAKGVVLPAELDGLKLAFNALDPEGEELTFGAGDKTSKATAVSHILGVMAAMKPRVPLGGRESPSTEFDASADAPKTATDFNARAKKLAEEKGLTFDAAAEQLGAELDAAA